MVSLTFTLQVVWISLSIEPCYCSVGHYGRSNSILWVGVYYVDCFIHACLLERDRSFYLFIYFNFFCRLLISNGVNIHGLDEPSREGTMDNQVVFGLWLLKRVHRFIGACACGKIDFMIHGSDGKQKCYPCFQWKCLIDHRNNSLAIHFVVYGIWCHMRNSVTYPIFEAYPMLH